MAVDVRRLVLSRRANVGVDVLASAVVHAATGYAAHRLGEDRLGREGWLLRSRAVEDGGRFYRRTVRIDSWKDRLPEAGDLLPGGISKRSLPAYDDIGLATFVRETRRAELAHWWALAAGPLFVLWNPAGAATLLALYAAAANLPFICVQRYNRARAQHAQQLRSARGHHVTNVELSETGGRAADDVPTPRT